MDCSFREKGRSLADSVRTTPDIEVRYVVGDVNNPGIRADAGDDALHRAGIVIHGAEIRRQGDDGRNCLRCCHTNNTVNLE